MPRTILSRRLLLAGVVLSASAPALAHHGWSWTTSDPFVLEGEVREVYLGNPHAYVDLDVDGTLWRVELAPPRSTQRAGFVEGVTSPGDALTAYGFRSLDAGENRMKAVRLMVDGTAYDVYPRRTGLFDG